MTGHAIGLTGDTTIVDWLRLIRAEYAEFPGLHLTKPQAHDLWRLDPWVCEALLDAFVDAGFLRRTRDDAYVRADARAEYKNGLLTVTAPIAAEAQDDGSTSKRPDTI